MTLMRGFSRVDEEGKIVLPNNIRREIGLKPGQLVELKVIGASRKKNLLLTPKEHAG